MPRHENALPSKTYVFESFAVSVTEFYALLEEMFASRAMPRTKVSKIYLSESGPLSPEREYLSVRRGDHEFLISAAAFGEGMMVSWRLRRRPSYTWLKLIAGTILFFLVADYLPEPVYSAVMSVFVTLLLILIFIGLPLVFAAQLFRKIPGSRLLLSGASGLLKWLWRRLRLPTFHELDSAVAFQQTVPAVMERALETLRAAQGLRSLGEVEPKELVPASGA